MPALLEMLDVAMDGQLASAAIMLAFVLISLLLARAAGRAVPANRGFGSAYQPRQRVLFASRHSRRPTR